MGLSQLQLHSSICTLHFTWHGQTHIWTLVSLWVGWPEATCLSPVGLGSDTFPVDPVRPGRPKLCLDLFSKRNLMGNKMRKARGDAELEDSMQCKITVTDDNTMVTSTQHLRCWRLSTHWALRGQKEWWSHCQIKQNTQVSGVMNEVKSLSGCDKMPVGHAFGATDNLPIWNCKTLLKTLQ